MILAVGGVASGLISGLVPSQFPELKLDNPEIVVNAEYAPLHAGIAFGAMLAAGLWKFGDRLPLQCLYAFVAIVFAWLAATNTAISIVGEFGKGNPLEHAELSQDNWEVLSWTLAGLISGVVGASLTLFGAADAAKRLHRTGAWVMVVTVGALAGLLLYPSVTYQQLVWLFVVWQASVAAAIGYWLAAPIRQPSGP